MSRVFRNKKVLTTHTYRYNRIYLEDTEDYDINFSLNMREVFITDKSGKYIEYIDEAINYSVDEIKNCYEKLFRKVKSCKYKFTAECEYKKRAKGEVKTMKIIFNTDNIVTNSIYDYGDFKHWLDFEKVI